MSWQKYLKEMNLAETYILYMDYLHSDGFSEVCNATGMIYDTQAGNEMGAEDENKEQNKDLKPKCFVRSFSNDNYKMFLLPSKNEE